MWLTQNQISGHGRLGLKQVNSNFTKSLWITECSLMGDNGYFIRLKLNLQHNKNRLHILSCVSGFAIASLARLWDIRHESLCRLALVLVSSSQLVTLAAMAAAVMWEEPCWWWWWLCTCRPLLRPSSSSSSSSHWVPRSMVCVLAWVLLCVFASRGEGEGSCSKAACVDLTLTVASRSRSMAWGRAGRMNWKHS